MRLWQATGHALLACLSSYTIEKPQASCPRPFFSLASFPSPLPPKRLNLLRRR
jgi:hypothetical protein